MTTRRHTCFARIDGAGVRASIIFDQAIITSEWRSTWSKPQALKWAWAHARELDKLRKARP